MTFPAEKMGDKGQRFILECTGYPDQSIPITEWQPVAYGEDEMALHRARKGLATNGIVISIRVRDRRS
jgi:hypothetical protein